MAYSILLQSDGPMNYVKACEKSTSPGRVTAPWESEMMSPCSSSASSLPYYHY